MKTVVIYYSFTGNNENLAKSLADDLNADIIKIEETNKRSTGKIILDMILSRTPKTEPSPERLKGYDFVLMVAPVWMGKVASPMKSYLKYLKKEGCAYGFTSISGGAMGDNKNLNSELTKVVARKPDFLMDLHIADLLILDKPTRKDTSGYSIDHKDIEKLNGTIINEIKSIEGLNLLH